MERVCGRWGPPHLTLCFHNMHHDTYNNTFEKISNIKLSLPHFFQHLLHTLMQPHNGHSKFTPYASFTPYSLVYNPWHFQCQTETTVVISGYFVHGSIVLLGPPHTYTQDAQFIFAAFIIQFLYFSLFLFP